MAFHLTSPAFTEGATIPTPFTGDGADRSPPLSWTDPPADTASFALVCEDPDAPRGTWIHWVLFNLPINLRSLPEGASPEKQRIDGSRNGITDFGSLGYGGPAPPKGKPHRYFFRLYALDQMLDLVAGSNRADLDAAVKGHVLAEATLMGTYQR